MVVVFAFVAGYGLGRSAWLEQEQKLMDAESHSRFKQQALQFPDFNGSRAQSDDAYRRWAIKAHEAPSSVREGWSPTLMAFPAKNCIQLTLEPGSVGGDPIYCYRANSLDLIDEYSDVE